MRDQAEHETEASAGSSTAIVLHTPLLSHCSCKNQLSAGSSLAAWMSLHRMTFFPALGDCKLLAAAESVAPVMAMPASVLHLSLHAMLSISITVRMTAAIQMPEDPCTGWPL